MNAIRNSWLEKERKKRKATTESAYESQDDITFEEMTAKKSSYHNPSLKIFATRTLRGVRK